MGNSLGPFLANIFMCYLEEKFILTAVNNKPWFYRRYVDDTFCMFHSIEEATAFLDFINDLHPSIKFDMEVELEGKLSFLDTIVSRVHGASADGDGCPEIANKFKATDKGLYYHYGSFIPEKYKTNMVFGKIYRMYQIASSMSIFHLDVTELTERLVKNGFPRDFVLRCVDRVLSKFHIGRGAKDRELGPEKKVISVFLPYLGLMSLVVKRELSSVIKKFYPGVELKVSFRRGFKIKDMFVRKDRFPLSCRSGVVYYTQCDKCGPSAAYIGKTINTVYERFHQSGTGHLHPNNVDSALLKHMSESEDASCKFVFEDVKILDGSKYDEQLCFIESILLKYEKQSLNTQERSVKLNIV